MNVRYAGCRRLVTWSPRKRSEEHTSELQSRLHLVCRLLLEKKKTIIYLHSDVLIRLPRSEHPRLTALIRCRLASEPILSVYSFRTAPALHPELCGHIRPQLH